ncbi:uncharacterized protein TM35_001501010 [Trypanosoma theileri]|uniref:Mucin-like glycoprotein n=1 Tax=Trypanosoma theileri TaxID=67003 RepID=A0A1X0NDL2_9TRYP|nr:uncharacterized protein TM35_001501010 [Trypanosoma theileri]ORC80671.1 hypothetical protein TM35_001501010 [Trypanosoma theileri]
MMMIMCRVMCVLAVVLCCTCGYTMAAAAAVDNDSPSGRGVSRGAVEVSCGAGGALRVRPAAESEWLTCDAGSRVSACGKYADLCSQRNARAATTTTTTTNGQPKAVMAFLGSYDSALLQVEWDRNQEKKKQKEKLEMETVSTSLQDPHQLQTETHQLEGTDGDLRNQSDEQASELKKGMTEENALAPPQEMPDPLPLSTVVIEERPSDKAIEQTPTDAAALKRTQQNEPHAQTAGRTNTTADSSENHNSSQSSLQSQSENNGENSPRNDDNSSNHPPMEAAATTTQQQNEEYNSATGTTVTNTLHGTNTTTPPSNENTTTEAPTTTPSPVPAPNTEISSIAPIVQQKTNVDSSVSPVWMRTAAPLLIVAVLFSVTMY